MPRFHPEGGDEGRDLVSVFVAATLVDMFRRRPKGVFDYWLRICTVRESVDRDGLASAGDLGGLLSHVRATYQEGTTQFVSRLAAWEAGSGAGQQLGREIRISGVSVPSSKRLKEPLSAVRELYGADFDFAAFADWANGDGGDAAAPIVGLAPALRSYHEALVDARWRYPVRSADTTSAAGLLPYFANTVEWLAESLDADAATLLSIPALKVTSGQGAENTLFSVLRLFSFVGEILDAARLAPGDREAMVRDRMARLRQLRSYPAPGFTDGGQGEGSTQGTRSASADDASADSDGASAAEDDDAGEGSASETARGELEGALCRWLGDLGRLEPPSPITLARIWTRFTYAFEGVRESLAHLKTRYLGVLTHRTIIVFLHAIGVEALRAAGREPPRKTLNNPIASSENFLSLLAHVFDMEGDWSSEAPDVDFFFALFSCPLWGYFLARKDSDIFEHVKKRQSPTESVFALYKECLASRVGDPPSFRVRLTNAKTQESATFDGLFSVLNTVQIQGQRPARRARTVGGANLSRKADPSNDVGGTPGGIAAQETDAGQAAQASTARAQPAPVRRRRPVVAPSGGAQDSES